MSKMHRARPIVAAIIVVVVNDFGYLEFLSLPSCVTSGK